jgi:hypothetical protein
VMRLGNDPVVVMAVLCILCKRLRDLVEGKLSPSFLSHGCDFLGRHPLLEGVTVVLSIFRHASGENPRSFDRRWQYSCVVLFLKTSSGIPRRVALWRCCNQWRSFMRAKVGRAPQPRKKTPIFYMYWAKSSPKISPNHNWPILNWAEICIGLSSHVSLHFGLHPWRSSDWALVSCGDGGM